jgi:hypothetical protein
MLSSIESFLLSKMVIFSVPISSGGLVVAIVLLAYLAYGLRLRC